MSENTDPAGKVRVSERAVADYRELPEDQQADAALALDRVGVTPGRPIQADVLGFTAGGDYFVMQAKRTGPGVVYRPGNPEHDGPDTGYVITAILSAGDVRKIRNAEALGISIAGGDPDVINAVGDALSAVTASADIGWRSRRS